MSHRLEFLFFEAFSLIARWLPYSALSRFGGMMGVLVFRLGVRRNLTISNLRHAFPEKDEPEIKRIARGAFRNVGIATMQLLWTRFADDDALESVVRIRDRTVLDHCLAAGQGVVLLSGHYGSWEFVAHGLRLRVGQPVHCVVQRQRNPYVNRAVDAARCRHGNTTIEMGTRSRGAIAVLRSGGILALLGDQSGPRESVFVDFFGRPAATHRGPAAFSLKTGAPLLFSVLIRQSDGSYLAPVDQVPTDDLKEYSEESVLELTRRHVKLLEDYVRAYPDQWLWMHKRWKHSPPVEPAGRD